MTEIINETEQLEEKKKSRTRSDFCKKAQSLARHFKMEEGEKHFPIEVIQLFALEYYNLIRVLEGNVSEVFRNKYYDYLIWIIVKRTLLAEEASIDYLTRIKNRRGCDSKLSLIARDHYRKKHSLEELNFSIIFFDLDHFKKINDTYGHHIGDLVLKEVAKSVRLSLKRPTDFFGRYGGEEFIIITKEKAESASRLAERIRLLIESIDFDIPELKVTASFGVTEFISDGIKDFEVAIKLAMKNASFAMYLSKERGRNRVTQKNV